MKWTWRFLALPGVAWLTVFFLIAFYAVICVAFGNQNTLSEPVPFWNPLNWNVGYVLEVLRNIVHGGQFFTVFVRTFYFVLIAVVLSLLIGYPVAYYAARHTGRWKGLLLVALILPFWINYLRIVLTAPPSRPTAGARGSSTRSGSKTCSSAWGSSRPPVGGSMDNRRP